MDAYNPDQVYSSIDHTSRYAYSNQPRIAQWNLARLAETFLPILADSDDARLEQAQQAIDGFQPRFQAAYSAGLCRKIGLHQTQPDDLALAQELLNQMALNQADFTQTFRGLCDSALDSNRDEDVRRLFADPSAYDAWAVSWRKRLEDEPGDAAGRRASMRSVNPMFIPRNHRVEEVIEAATKRADFEPFEALLKVLAKPFDDQPEFTRYAQPPMPEQIVRQTFCGT